MFCMKIKFLMISLMIMHGSFTLRASDAGENHTAYNEDGRFAAFALQAIYESYLAIVGVNHHKHSVNKSEKPLKFNHKWKKTTTALAMAALAPIRKNHCLHQPKKK